MGWSLLPSLRLGRRLNVAPLPPSLRRAPRYPQSRFYHINRATQSPNRSPVKLRLMSSSLEGALDPPAKKQKMEEDRKVCRPIEVIRQLTNTRQIIGTHNGTFHCDEALAVYLLKRTKAYGSAGTGDGFTHRLVTEFSDVDLKRTRDPAVLDTCSIVVDVGGVYDESKQRFDHHQRGFQEVFGHGFNTKLSSAGLVYKYVHLRFSCYGAGCECDCSVQALRQGNHC